MVQVKLITVSFVAQNLEQPHYVHQPCGLVQPVKNQPYAKRHGLWPAVELSLFFDVDRLRFLHLRIQTLYILTAPAHGIARSQILRLLAVRILPSSEM